MVCLFTLSKIEEEKVVTQKMICWAYYGELRIRCIRRRAA